MGIATTAPSLHDYTGLQTVSSHKLDSIAPATIEIQPSPFDSTKSGRWVLTKWLEKMGLNRLPASSAATTICSF